MTDRRRPTDRRPLAAVVLCLLAAPAALWGASRMHWAVPAVGGHVVAERGSVAVSGLVPLALVALAALAAQFAGGPWLKRAVGVLLALSALYLCWRAAAGAAAVAASGQAGAGADGQDPWARAVTGLGALLELGAAAVLLLRPAALPAMGARYSRKKEPPADPDQRMWEDLSGGTDPTGR